MLNRTVGRSGQGLGGTKKKREAHRVPPAGSCLGVFWAFKTQEAPLDERKIHTPETQSATERERRMNGNQFRYDIWDARNSC